MKVKYIGNEKKQEFLQKDLEYYCCGAVFSTTDNTFDTLFLIFDNKNFLNWISMEDIKVVDGRKFDSWEINEIKNTPIQGPYNGFVISFIDKRVKDVGEWDEVIDLDAHIADQEETGDCFIDTDGIKDRLNELRRSIEKEHAKSR